MLLMSLIFTVILSDLLDFDQGSYSEFTFLSHGISAYGERIQELTERGHGKAVEGGPDAQIHRGKSPRYAGY